MLFHLHRPAVVLAALLQVLPLARTLITNPATGSTFAIILRWGIGAGAVVGSVDAVSGANVLVHFAHGVQRRGGDLFHQQCVGDHRRR
jgi:hypothetical protein